jgi:uncharacterized protein
MHITAFYAGILCLLYLALAANVIRTRRALQVGLGDGGQLVLQRRIRAHGNFAEYVPLALLLMAFVESGGLGPRALHGLGIALLLGRLAHAWALSSVTPRPAARVAGMALTLGPIGLLAVRCLLQFAR